MPSHTPHELHHDAADAKRDAEEVAKRFTDKLTQAVPNMSVPWWTELNELIRELRSSDYEAGYSSGYVAGYLVGFRDGRKP